MPCPLCKVLKEPFTIAMRVYAAAVARDSRGFFSVLRRPASFRVGSPYRFLIPQGPVAHPAPPAPISRAHRLPWRAPARSERAERNDFSKEKRPVGLGLLFHRFLLSGGIYTPPHRKWERKLSLEFSAPSRPADGKPDSLHPCGAARWCREPYSGAISPRVSAEKAGPLSSG